MHVGLWLLSRVLPYLYETETRYISADQCNDSKINVHCKQDPFREFPEMKLRGLVFNFHNHFLVTEGTTLGRRDVH
jgi:hypothetical protein